MKSVEYYLWMLPPDPWRRKPSPSTYKMDRETAEKRYPGATPILSSREVRNCPETPEEALANQMVGYGKHPLG